jgi:hypothetical protein
MLSTPNISYLCTRSKETDPNIFGNRYIYLEWFPTSAYDTDDPEQVERAWIAGEGERQKEAEEMGKKKRRIRSY